MLLPAVGVHRGFDMKKIIEGVKRFRHEEFDRKRELFEKLKGGQRPEVAFITCSDSRVNPNLFTQTEPGELFIIRNVGNIVPAYDPSACTSEAAAIEYAVSVLKVRHIVVCGHSHCGAMQGLLNPEGVADLPSVVKWLTHATATSHRVKALHPGLSGDALLEKTIEEHALQQLKNIETHPSVVSAMARGTVELHGWTYTFETGEVRALDRSGGGSVLLTDG